MEKGKRKKGFSLLAGSGGGGDFGPAERACACTGRRPSRPTSGGQSGDGTMGAGPRASEGGGDGVRG
jgi:hypothetical protein